MFVTLAFSSINLTTAKQYTFTLTYNNHYEISTEKEIGRLGGLLWSFQGSEQQIGVSVWIFDHANYTKYLNKDSTTLGYRVSNGTQSFDANIWQPPKTDIWHIVFVGTISNPMDTTTIAVSLSVITEGMIIWAMVLSSAIPTLLTIGIVILIVIVSFRSINKRKEKEKSILPQEVNSTQSIAEPQGNSDTQFDTPKDIFCSRCGFKNTGDSSFCGICGAKLRKYQR